MDAVYPALKAIPFQQQLLDLAEQRTGKSLLLGELGCLMSHRKVWQRILKSNETDQTHFLILESDSQLINPDLLSKAFTQLTIDKDLFFWGAWEGHMQFFKTSKQRVDQIYTIGEPFIKTVYCTYGYSINKKAAKLLLKRTAKIGYPVDQFKKFFSQEELKLGGILPEVITGNQVGSTIRNGESVVFKYIFLQLLDIKNYVICSLR